MEPWKRGDLCTVAGEGDIAFRVREAPSRRYRNSAYLERVDGLDGALGHGREGLGNLVRLHLADLMLVTVAKRRP
jgi:hypothetical protein